MFTQKEFQVLQEICFGLCILSLIGSAYIIRSWWIKKQKNENELLEDYVAYMSMADFAFTLQAAIYSSNPAFDITFISNLSDPVCGILGAIWNFTKMCSQTMNFAISLFILLPLLNGESMHRIKKNSQKHLIFVFVMSMISTIIPILHKKYGFTDAGAQETPKFECWVKDKNYYLINYIPLAIYMAFSICLLIYTYFWKFRKKPSLKKLASNSAWYIIVFVLIFIGAAINRFYNVIKGSSPNFFIIIHSISKSVYGVANAMVWYSFIKPDEDVFDGGSGASTFTQSLTPQSAINN